MELSPKTLELVAATEALLNDGKATLAEAEALEQKARQRLTEIEWEWALIKARLEEVTDRDPQSQPGD